MKEVVLTEKNHQIVKIQEKATYMMTFKSMKLEILIQTKFIEFKHWYKMESMDCGSDHADA